jgi:hypothetical protein
MLSRSIGLWYHEILSSRNARQNSMGLRVQATDIVAITVVLHKEIYMKPLHGHGLASL